MTIGELQLGVLSASHDATRAPPAQTLAPAPSADPIPISEAVMGSWAGLLVDCRAAGLQRTVRLIDVLIAATAVEYGLPVVTQHGDYDQIAAAHPLLQVIKV